MPPKAISSAEMRESRMRSALSFSSQPTQSGLKCFTTKLQRVVHFLDGEELVEAGLAVRPEEAEGAQEHARLGRQPHVLDLAAQAFAHPVAREPGDLGDPRGRRRRLRGGLRGGRTGPRGLGRGGEGDEECGEGEQSAHGGLRWPVGDSGIMPLSPPASNPTMNYKRLGRAGLKVSELSFGSWVTYGNQLDTKAASECMAAAWDLGVNFFDNAEVYAAGESERIMGEVLKKLAWPRLKYVVSTKFFWGITDGPNEHNTLNRKYLMQGDRRVAQAPAARPRRPRLLPPPGPRDAHRGDGVGDARHDPAGQGPLLGHLRVERLRDHGRLADRRAPPPRQAGRRAAAVQPLPQEARGERVPPPLQRHRAGAHRLEPARLGTAHGQVPPGRPEGQPRRHPAHGLPRPGAHGPEEEQRRSGALEFIAKELGCTLSQLAIAWCAKNPHVSSVITGASRVEQVKENLKALEFVPRITAPMMERIEGIVAGHGE